MLLSDVLILFCVVIVCECVGNIFDSMLIDRFVCDSCSVVCKLELFVLMIMMLNLWCGREVLIVVIFYIF